MNTITETGDVSECGFFTMTPNDLLKYAGKLPAFVQWLVLIATILTAFSVIWKKLILPAKKGCLYVVEGVQVSIANHYILKETAPLLKAIAKEFKTNNGSTLKDQLTRIEEKADNAMRSASAAVEDARKAAIRADEVHEIVVHLKDNQPLL
jgi:hypothetical protein